MNQFRTSLNTHSAELMGRQRGGLLCVKWRVATCTQKAGTLTVQANLLAEH